MCQKQAKNKMCLGTELMAKRGLPLLNTVPLNLSFYKRSFHLVGGYLLLNSVIIE